MRNSAIRSNCLLDETLRHEHDGLNKCTKSNPETHRRPKSHGLFVTKEVPGPRRSNCPRQYLADARAINAETNCDESEQDGNYATAAIGASNDELGRRGKSLSTNESDLF
jgi:hypothetical protein